MKVTVKRCVATVTFLAVFGWLFVHVSYALRGTLAHTQNNLSGYYDLDKDSLDVVFVGTSGTFSAFSPMYAWERYGFASYDFCTNVLAVDNMATLVREALKTQSPKVLVIDIVGFMNHIIKALREYEVRYNTDGYKYSLDRLKMIWDTFPEDWDKTPFVFDLIKYHTNTFSWKNFFGQYHNVNKGFNFLSYAAAEPTLLTDERQAISEDFEKALDDLLKECDRYDETSILFLYYPYGLIREGFPDVAELNYMQDIIEGAGYPFLNCEEIRDEFGLDYLKDFAGNMHFDIYGAEKITTVIGAYLQDTYDLPDRRDDPAYSEWNDDLYPYHRNVKSAKAAVDAAVADNAAGEG